MAKVEAWYEQDLKRPVRINYFDGSFFNQDAAGSRIGVKVYSDGQAVTLAGSITGYCVQADGTTVPIAGTKSSNMAYIDIPQSALSVPGPLTVTIKNTESSVITTLCAVVGIVTQSRTGVQVDPGQTVTDWTNLISAQLQACQDAADNVGAIVAVPYANLTFPVEVNTYTTYNGNLYCCTTRIATSESFTAAHWRQTNVCSEIGDLRSASVKMYPKVVYKTNPSELSDLNSAELNSLYYLRLSTGSGGYSPTNLPSDFVFTNNQFVYLLTVTSEWTSPQSGSTGMQYLFDKTLTLLYSRAFNNIGTVTFEAWTKSVDPLAGVVEALDSSAIKEFAEVINKTNQATKLSDLDNAKGNTLYYYRYYDGFVPSHFPSELDPTDETFFNILTLKCYNSNAPTNGTGLQFVCDKFLKPLYFRLFNYSGSTYTWTDWEKHELYLLDSTIASIESDISDLETAVAEIKQNPDKLMPVIYFDGNGQDPCFFGRWYDKTVSDVESKFTSNPGSQCYVRVLSATTITVGFTSYYEESGQTPYWAYSIDGGAPVRQAITSNTIPIPDTGFHNVAIFIDSNTVSSYYRYRENGVGISSVTCDGTIRGIKPYARTIAFFGDSITEGVNSLGGSRPSVLSECSAVNSYPYFASKEAGFVPWFSAFAGTGASNTGSADGQFATHVIKLSNSKYVGDYHFDMVVVNYGYNDSAQTSEAFTAGYKAGLNELLTLYPSIPIVILVPFAQTKRTELLAIYDDYKDAYNVYLCDTSNWGYTPGTAANPVDTTDGSHPKASVQEELGGKLAEWMVATFGKEWFLQR